MNNNLNIDKPYPLEDVLVIDLTHVLAGPTCARMLADAGARVIHVERKKLGDDTRAMGPYMPDGSSEYFRIANVGKESIALNFKDPEDFALLKNMISKADVVVENFRPGVMTKLGLDPHELLKEFPHLIVASISGFGQFGPMSKQGAFDTVIQAVSGIMDSTGTKEGGPTRVGTSISDIIGGIFGYAGIVTALYAREKTGKGTTVDIAMLDSTFALMSQGLMTVLGKNERIERIGNRHPYMYPFDTFMTSDTSLAICTGNDHLFEILAQELNHKEWVEDDRFNTNEKRSINWKPLKDLIENELRKDTADNWEKKLLEVGIPTSKVLNLADTCKMPQIIERGMVKELKDGNLIPGTPMKFSTWNSYGIKNDSPTLDEEGKSIRAEFSNKN